MIELKNNKDLIKMRLEDVRTEDIKKSRVKKK